MPKAYFFTIQKALPLMDKNGSIILNGSFIGSCGFPGMAVYGATKAAVRSFARTFTAELKGNGPRVNVISPGPIHTAGNAATMANNPQVLDYVRGMVPLGRIGEGSDVGKVAVFLASGDSSFVAGVDCCGWWHQRCVTIRQPQILKRRAMLSVCFCYSGHDRGASLRMRLPLYRHWL